MLTLPALRPHLTPAWSILGAAPASTGRIPGASVALLPLPPCFRRLPLATTRDGVLGAGTGEKGRGLPSTRHNSAH